MINVDVLIGPLTEKLRRYQLVALAANKMNDKQACEDALNEQVKILDSLMELIENNRTK